MDKSQQQMFPTSSFQNGKKQGETRRIKRWKIEKLIFLLEHHKSTEWDSTCFSFFRCNSIASNRRRYYYCMFCFIADTWYEIKFTKNISRKGSSLQNIITKKKQWGKELLFNAHNYYYVDAGRKEAFGHLSMFGLSVRDDLIWCRAIVQVDRPKLWTIWDAP